MTVPAYYDRINHQLLESIPKNLGRIIEVGCGTGSLGAAYKQDNPNSEYIGLELNPEPFTSPKTGSIAPYVSMSRPPMRAS